MSSMESNKRTRKKARADVNPALALLLFIGKMKMYGGLEMT
jgi:hypothetical protein